jgi:hypothetical protein
LPADGNVFDTVAVPGPRGLLNRARAKLAAAAGVSVFTLHGFESKKSRTHGASVTAIQSVPEGKGVDFVETGEGRGIWLRAHQASIGDEAVIAADPAR